MRISFVLENLLNDFKSSAPQIYEKSLDLIALWSLKSSSADGKPFAARQDIFDAAMDIVGAAAFGFEDDMAIVKRQIEYFRENGVKTEENPNGSVDFPRLPLVGDVATLKAVAGYMGFQIMSPFPRITHMYCMSTNSKLRRDIARKDDIIKRQITDSINRFKNGDDTLRSATDYLIQREYSVATKEGRDPDIFSRRTIDEVKSTRASNMCHRMLTLHSSSVILSQAMSPHLHHYLVCISVPLCDIPMRYFR